MKKINIEDMITAVCEYFCENIHDLGYDKYLRKYRGGHASAILWYMQLTDRQRRLISNKLLDIIEKDIDQHGSNSDRKHTTNKKV